MLNSLLIAAVALATGASLVCGQCDDILPDGLSCKDQVDASLFADPDDCTMYYECENGCAEHKLCERNFLFDNKFGYCNYPLDVDCGDRPCNNAEHCLTTVSTTTVTTTPDCGHVQDCNELGEGYHPDPYNCRKYWHCYPGGRTEHVLCPENQLYDPDNIWCDYPERVSCGDRPVCDECDNNCVTEPSPGPTTPDCGHMMDCTNKTDGYYPDQFNCRKYWHCVKGQANHFMCEDNLLYDPINVWCNYPDLVECGDRPVCGPCDEDCVSTTTSPKPCDHEMDCSSMPDGWYPDPYNCRKYWHCEHGLGKHYTCQGQLVYNEINVWCDYEDRVNCGQRPICDDCDENCRWS